MLWLIKGLGPGGAEQLLVSLATTIDHAAFDITACYLLTDRDALAVNIERAGVPTKCLRLRRSPGPGWVRSIRALLRAGRFDVVHVHSPMVAVVTRLVVRTLRRSDRPAVVVTEHNVASAYGAATRLLDWSTAPLDDARFAVSEEVRRSLPRWLRPSTETLVHGVPVESLRAYRGAGERVRAELGVPSDSLLVLTVANYRSQKGYRDLFAAASRVRHQMPNVRFAAVGQGPLEDRVRSWHAAAELGDGFALLGYRDDVPSLLAAADVLAVASTAEGLPVAVMEALAVGVPVVATAVGGVPELIRDGREGLLVPPEDPAALAGALLDVLGDDTKRAAMADAARRSGARVDIVRAARRYEGEYRRLAAGAGRTGTPLRSATMRASKWLASTGDIGMDRGSGLVILVYHRVGAGTGVEIDLSKDRFAEQMAFIEQHAHVVTLDQGLAAVDRDERCDLPLVAITFDDGTADFAEHAAPVLADHHLPCTLYVATDYLEAGRDFPHEGRPLSWSALRDACAGGLIEVGSHTHCHLLLDRAADDDVATDLDRSIELIEDRLGTTPRHFAYPKALLGSPGAQRAVRARFDSAAIAGTRPNRRGATDPYRLARSPIQVSDGMRWFERKVRGGMWMEDALRRASHRWRYRGAQT